MSKAEDIQILQSEIASKNAQISHLQAQLSEVYREEDRSGIVLAGSSSIPRQIEQLQKEIKRLQDQIDNHK